VKQVKKQEGPTVEATLKLVDFGTQDGFLFGLSFLVGGGKKCRSKIGKGGNPFLQTAGAGGNRQNQEALNSKKKRKQSQAAHSEGKRGKPPPHQTIRQPARAKRDGTTVQVGHR